MVVGGGGGLKQTGGDQTALRSGVWRRFEGRWRTVEAGWQELECVSQTERDVAEETNGLKMKLKRRRREDEKTRR